MNPEADIRAEIKAHCKALEKAGENLDLPEIIQQCGAIDALIDLLEKGPIMANGVTDAKQRSELIALWSKPLPGEGKELAELRVAALTAMTKLSDDIDQYRQALKEALKWWTPLTEVGKGEWERLSELVEGE